MGYINTEWMITGMVELSGMEYCQHALDAIRSETTNRIIKIMAISDVSIADSETRDERTSIIINTWHRIRSEERITMQSQVALLEFLEDPKLLDRIESEIMPKIRIQQSDENRKFIQEYLEDSKTRRYTARHVIADVIKIARNYPNIEK